MMTKDKAQEEGGEPPWYGAGHFHTPLKDSRPPTSALTRIRWASIKVALARPAGSE